MDNITIYIVGVETPEDNWMCEAIFYSEEEAVKHCKPTEFIVPAIIPGRFPEKAIDAAWIWWPHQSTKEKAIEIMNEKKKEAKPNVPKPAGPIEGNNRERFT